MADWLGSNIMEIQAIYPKRQTSVPNKKHKVFPYLFRSIRIEYPIGIHISMDGEERVYDNIFIGRLWHTVKYEEAYLHDYKSIREVKAVYYGGKI